MRHDLDFYESPKWFTTTLLTYTPAAFWQGAIIGEPCAGHGAIARPMRQAGLTVWTGDIDPEKCPDYTMDATQWDGFPAADIIVTNPPFKQAAAILKTSYARATRGVALFLRASFEEGCENRRDFLNAHPPTMRLVLPRYAFRRGAGGRWSTDSCTINAYLWDKSKNNGSTKSLWLAPENVPGFTRNPDEEALCK